MINKVKDKYLELNTTARASIWFLICSFMQRGISVLTTPIFTRLLSTSEYGQYNVFNSWLGIITVFVTLSLFNGMYNQGLIKFNEEKDILSSSMQGMTLTMVVIWSCVYFIFKDSWNYLLSLTTEQMVIMFAMIWSSAVYSFWAAEQRVDLKYKTLVAVTIIVSIAKPLIGILLVIVSKDKVTARIFGLALVEIICNSWMFFYHLHKGKKFFSWKYWKYAFLFSVPLIPHYLAQNLLANSDRVMIEKSVGFSEAGIYSLAYSIAQIMLLFNNALTQTISPWIMRKIKNRDVSRISNVVISTTSVIAIINIFLIALAPEIVSAFAPKSYRNAIWVIPPVALSVVFQYVYGLLASYEFYFEKRAFISAATLTSAGLNVFLNWLLIPIFGFIAASYTTLVCYFLLFLGHYVFVQKISYQNFDGKNACNSKVLFSLLFGVVFIGLSFILTYEMPILRYTILAIMGVALAINHRTVVRILKEIISKRESNGGC